MSKGQQRSNREKRKPKKERDKDPVKASSVTAAFERPSLGQIGAREEEITAVDPDGFTCRRGAGEHRRGDHGDGATMLLQGTRRLVQHACPIGSTSRPPKKILPASTMEQSHNRGDDREDAARRRRD